jgi:uncharacterized membrane protein YkvA (DUF1232 family)
MPAQPPSGTISGHSPLSEIGARRVSSGLRSAVRRGPLLDGKRHDAQGGDTVTWTTASLKAAAIVIYFVLATVWLPDFVLALGFIEDSSDFIGDLIVSAVWSTALLGGIWALRIGQRRGLI